MTNFAVQSTMGALSPLVSKEKGSVGNRMDCAGAHLKNNATTLAQTAAVGATAYGATRAVANNMFGFGGITRGLAKTFDYAMKGLGKLTKNPDLTKQVTEKLAKWTAPNGFTKSKVPGIKALAVIAAVTLPALGYIAHNHSYKAGQIDQKYTDKAQLQKTL